MRATFAFVFSIEVEPKALFSFFLNKKKNIKELKFVNRLSAKSCKDQGLFFLSWGHSGDRLWYWNWEERMRHHIDASQVYEEVSWKIKPPKEKKKKKFNSLWRLSHRLLCFKVYICYMAYEYNQETLSSTTQKLTPKNQSKRTWNAYSSWVVVCEVVVRFFSFIKSEEELALPVPGLWEDSLLELGRVPFTG